MSEDIKGMFENILKETDTAKRETMLLEYQKTINELSLNSDKFKEVESKGIFQELKETRAKLDLIEKEKKDKEEADALEKGKFKELAEARQKELDEFKTKFSNVETKAKEWETYEATKRKAILDKIEDVELKKVAEEIKGLDSLEIFANKMTKAETFSTENGQSNNTPVVLTPEQKADALKMGVKESDYLEIMAHRNRNKQT
jgi:hypothetical protein